MYIEEKLLQEHIITRDHIDELYNIFVLIGDNSRFKLIPLDFTKTFQAIAISKQINADPEIWSQYFIQIDWDKDGRIDFQDFLRYTTQNFKLLLGELKNKNSLNTLKSLNSLSTKKCFNHCLSNFFLRILNVINPFALTASVKNLLPFYKNYSQQFIRKNGEFLQKDSNTLFSLYSQMITSMNNKEIIVKITTSLGSNNGDIVLDGMNTLTKLLKPLSFISSHFEVISFINPLLEGLKSMAINGLFEKLISYLNMTLYSDLERRLLHLLIKNLTRIIHISQYLFELEEYSMQEPFTYYSKENSIDIKNYKEFIEKTIIKHILLKLANLLSNEEDLFHRTNLLCISICKLGIPFLSTVFSESNYLEILLVKIEKYVKTIDKKIKEQELKKLLYYCFIIMEQICISKDFNIGNFNVIIGIIEKFSRVATVLQDIFFQSEDITFMNLYLLFLSMLAFKGNFNDKLFILKFTEVNIITNQAQIMNSFYFYIRNILLNQAKTGMINLISELKILNIFYSYSKINELFISDFYDLIEIIITNQSNELMASAIIREIIKIFAAEITHENYFIVKKIVLLLGQIGKLNDIIIFELILDSELLFQMIHIMETFMLSPNIYTEYYLISKKLFDTIFLGNILGFLSNLINSDVSKCSYKFIKHFNLSNLQCITRLFAILYDLWEDISKNNENKNDDKHNNALITNNNEAIEIFEKFKDLPSVNLLENIIEIFESLEYFFNEGLNFNTKLKETLEKYDNQLSLENIIAFIKGTKKEMNDKITILQLNNEDNSNIPNKPIRTSPLLTIYTQSMKENQQSIWTTFDFPTESLTYYDVVNSIQKSYESELEFYVFNNEEKHFTKLKNENDFNNHIKTLLSNKQSIIENQNIVYMHLFLNEKAKKTKIMTQCMNCQKNIEIESTASDSIIFQDDLSKPFCDDCRKYFFSQIANQIAVNKSMMTPTHNNISSINSLNLNSSLLSTAQPYRVLNQTTFIDK